MMVILQALAEDRSYQICGQHHRVNKNMGGSFVPLIKMTKGGNRNAGWPIRNFHIGCMLCGYDARHRYRPGNRRRQKSAECLRLSVAVPVQFDPSMEGCLR